MLPIETWEGGAMTYEPHCECYIDINSEDIVQCTLCHAAPDLLEALREILSEFEGNYDGVFYDAVSALRIQGISRNAIAKTTE